MTFKFILELQEYTVKKKLYIYIYCIYVCVCVCVCVYNYPLSIQNIQDPFRLISMVRRSMDGNTVYIVFSAQIEE